MRRAPKGEYRVSWEDSDVASLQRLRNPVRAASRRRRRDAMSTLHADVRASGSCSASNLWLAVELLNGLDDDLWLVTLQRAGERAGVPLVAAGDVHMHVRSRKPLQDVLTAVREGKTVAECGFALQSNAERHLRPRVRLAELYPARAAGQDAGGGRALQLRSRVIRETTSTRSKSCAGGETPAQTLARKTWEGAQTRYPQGIPDKVRTQIEHELDADRRAELRDVLPHGRRHRALRARARTSSARAAARPPTRRSATAWASPRSIPRRGHLLFERFISRERNEPPDIDVDFEHQRREEVIQYIYEKYGRERAAIAAVVICYRSRSALRDVGKALGIDARAGRRFAKDHYWFDDDVLGERLASSGGAIGVHEDQLQLRQWLELTQQLRGFPRHLSQHVGGFVLTQAQAHAPGAGRERVDGGPHRHPVGQGRPRGPGLLKVDVLALGMLSAHPPRARSRRASWRGTPFAHAGHPRRTTRPPTT